MPTLASTGDHGQSSGALGRAGSAHDVLGMAGKPQMPRQQLTRGKDGAYRAVSTVTELVAVRVCTGVTGGRGEDLQAPGCTLPSVVRGPVASASSGAY